MYRTQEIKVFFAVHLISVLISFGWENLPLALSLALPLLSPHFTLLFSIPSLTSRLPLKWGGKVTGEPTGELEYKYIENLFCFGLGGLHNFVVIIGFFFFTPASSYIIFPEWSDYRSLIINRTKWCKIKHLLIKIHSSKSLSSGKAVCSFSSSTHLETLLEFDKQFSVLNKKMWCSLVKYLQF